MRHAKPPAAPEVTVDVIETRTITVRLSHEEISAAVRTAALAKAHRSRSGILPMSSAAEFKVEFQTDRFDNSVDGATVVITEQSNAQREPSGSSAQHILDKR